MTAEKDVARYGVIPKCGPLAEEFNQTVQDFKIVLDAPVVLQIQPDVRVDARK
ncbi:hypothetical protein ACOJBM_03465 [Rhizobium beringeri]